MPKPIETLSEADVAVFRTAVLGAIEPEAEQIANHEVRIDALEGGAPVITDATTARTASLADLGSYIRFTSDDPVTYTIPLASVVPAPVNAVISVEQAGEGVVTLVKGDDAIALNSRGGALATAGQFAVAQLKCVAADVWTIIGDVA